MQAITEYLTRNGYTAVDDTYYAQIALWQSWYQGKVNSFHTYTQYNGQRKVTRQRKTMGMAKRFCEDWAALLLNEKVRISVGNEAAQAAMDEILKRNRFSVRANQLVELAFALGTGAFVEYLDGGEVVIDYVRGSMIYPLAWDNGIITECAFASERKQGTEKYIYLNIHRRDAQGRYIIENKMFRRNRDTISPTDLPEGVADEVVTGSELPYFQIITPNIVNNVDLSSPMGISVFANAIDNLQNIDLVFDAYDNEFRLGKKRVLVPLTLTQTTMADSGVTKPVFDDNDVEFYVIDTGEQNTQKIEEMNGALRYDAFEAGIKTAINLAAYKCGFGENRYRFESGTAMTATQVISQDSDLFRNLKKHELVLDAALQGLIKAVAQMAGIGIGEITIEFDDSIIEDEDKERQRFMQEIREGLRQPWEYRVKYFGEAEEQARAMTAIQTIAEGFEA